MFNEKELVDKILEGDFRAFGILVDKYKDLVTHISIRILRDIEESQDVCQEIFLKIHQKLYQFKFNSKLSTWIARISYSTSLNHLRKLKHRNNEFLEIDEQEYYPALSIYQTPEDILINKDIGIYIHQIINTLPLKYRTVLTLYHLDEFSYEEIKEITEMPVGTIKNYLFRARLILKKELQIFIKEKHSSNERQ